MFEQEPIFRRLEQHARRLVRRFRNFRSSGTPINATDITSLSAGEISEEYSFGFDDVDNSQWISLSLSREEAKNSLLKSEYEAGSFLITMNHQHDTPEELGLLVKTRPICETTFNVLLLKIDIINHSFRILERAELFKTLRDLVQYYAEPQPEWSQILTFSAKHNKSVTSSVKSIEILNQLDAGEFAQVYRGQLFDSAKVALKILNSNTKDKLVKEAEISMKCDHLNVLKTIGICNRLNAIITEYSPGGNLKNYLHDHFLSPADCLAIARQIAGGMAYLASRRIIHRDLAARNILVGKTIDTIKISDFGLSRRLEESQYYVTSDKRFPFRWTAPEGFTISDNIVKMKPCKISYAADVWSFGILLWELYSDGAEPYSNIPDSELHRKLTRAKFRLDCPSKCPKKTVYAKMLVCWRINAKKRPNFDELQTFLSGIPDSKKPFQYESHQLQFMDRIGPGHFGEVFQGTIFTRTLVLIKTVDIRRTSYGNFQKEAELVLKHPNILETFGFCIDRPLIITEYMQNGSLDKYLQNHVLPFEEEIIILEKIANGMIYLSEKRIVHRDLAARNIFVGETIDTIKIANFDLSVFLGECDVIWGDSLLFAYKWTAPEAMFKYERINIIRPGITHPGIITLAADVWSYGVLMWEIYSSSEPYRDISDTLMLYDKLFDGERLPQPERCPDEVYKMMLKCWNIDREARPNFSEIQEFFVDMPKSVVANLFLDSDTEESDSDSKAEQLFGLGYMLHLAQRALFTAQCVRREQAAEARMGGIHSSGTIGSIQVEAYPLRDLL